MFSILLPLLLAASASHAADAAWTGAADNFWTNNANWSASPYPGSATGETATFSGAGNGNTVIDLGGHTGVRNVAFGAGAAAYTLGTGVPGGQTLVLGSTLSTASGLAAPQTVNAALQLGTDRAAGTYIVTNPSPALVTFADGIAGAPSGGTGAIGAETLAVNGAAIAGTYLLDVTATGASDLLTVNGGTDVSGLTVEVVAPALLDTSKIYTVAQFNGARTGTLSLANAPENWHLAYAPDGSVKLLFSRGTLLFLK